MSATHAASVSPGRKPIKDWSEKSPELEAALQRMTEKCRKNAEPKVEVMPDAQPDVCRNASNVVAGVASAENTPCLHWTQSSSHVMTTKCGLYQVVKEYVGEHTLHDGTVTSTGRWIYQPWVRVQWLWYIRMGASLGSFAKCQEACEAHLAKAEA